MSDHPLLEGPTCASIEWWRHCYLDESRHAFGGWTCVYVCLCLFPFSSAGWTWHLQSQGQGSVSNGSKSTETMHAFTEAWISLDAASACQCCVWILVIAILWLALQLSSVTDSLPSEWLAWYVATCLNDSWLLEVSVMSGYLKWTEQGA